MNKIKQVDNNFYFYQKQQKFNKITKVIILEKTSKYDLITINILLESLTDRIKTLNRHEFKLKKALNYGLNFLANFKEIDNNLLINLEVSFIDLDYVEKKEAIKIVNMINKIFSELFVQNSNVKLKINDYYNYLESLKDNPAQISKFLINDMLYVNDSKYLSYENTIEYLKKEDVIIYVHKILDTIKNSENFYYFMEGSKNSNQSIRKLLKVSKKEQLEVNNDIKRDVSLEMEKKSQIKRDNQASVIITYQSKDIKKEDEYTLRLLNLILGGNSGSKLFMNVREKENICYSIYSQDKLDYGIDVIIEVDKKNIELAIKRIDEELISIQEGNIDLEFKISKDKYISNLKANSNKGFFQKILLDKKIIRKTKFESVDELLKLVENITKEDVIRLSKKLKRIKILEKN